MAIAPAETASGTAIARENQTRQKAGDMIRNSAMRGSALVSVPNPLRRETCRQLGFEPFTHAASQKTTLQGAPTVPLPAQNSSCKSRFA